MSTLSVQYLFTPGQQLDDIADAGKRERANVAAQGESIHEGLRLHGETIKDEIREKRTANEKSEKKGLYVHCMAKAGLNLLI